MQCSMIAARLCFAIKRRRTYLYAILFLLLIVALDRFLAGSVLTADDSVWRSWLDPIVGLGTLFTAFAVWWEEVGQDWRNTLPKRLTVEFTYQGRRVMKCEDAHLSSEGDIRAFGQQIGLQMAEVPKLDLIVPSVEFSSGEVKRSLTGEFQLLYTAKFELSSLPDKLKSLGASEYLSWTPPFGPPTKRQ